MPKKLIEFFKAGHKGHQSSSVCRTRPGTVSEGGAVPGRFLQQVESAMITRGGLASIYPWGNFSLNILVPYCSLNIQLLCINLVLSVSYNSSSQAVACSPVGSRGAEVFLEKSSQLWSCRGPESPCSEPGHLSHGPTSLLGRGGLNQITTA